MTSDIKLQRIAVIGFGEAGSILGEDLVKAGREVVTYDILLDSAATRAALVSRAEKAGVRAVDSLHEAVGGADLVISAVTATSSADVAKSAAAVLQREQLFLDINSVSPATK